MAELFFVVDEICCVSNIKCRIYKYGDPLQGTLMAWTVHGKKEIKKGPVEVGA